MSETKRMVKVKGVGHGSGFNRYPVEFTFEANQEDSDEYISLKARRLLKDKTACDCVTITDITLEVSLK